ncbi:hypothetical protein QN362_07035 [Actimicrobium sp. CCC2.4]|uniref:oxygen-dependent tRNA uridine(34) hydroxylase TrhO n=1 Tax=Actimicrobium sp. CCC2.4 TaxID=3048606 RepID=UPI002AC929AD|nr:rhodanese-like domain-containing protein [Actimicrobium sp. CCC2.4]MEB0135080.1 hypothetical protein [Actimicrobium sp. CCC2.4]WPX31873.1 hypothetical protein RHM62_16800 [Actimicrobium sp. CCC2.4]
MTSSTPDSPASSGSAQPLQHSAFYKFVVLPDPDAVVLHLRELTSALLGSILVAEEGINGVLAGTAADLDAFEGALAADPRFTGIVFKRSGCVTPPFGRLKIHRKSEIVFMGVPGIDAVRPTGISVSPQQWRELIAADDVVVIDNRNSFEYRLGKFNNAVDPLVANFRDFPEYIKANAPAWQAAGKRVAMYCTGGIRCEKTSAWMQDMGIAIYQLDGGILNYFQTMPDAGKDWQGECFVFDNRIALDTHLNETTTTLEDVYDGEPDGEWRLQRARRLAQSGS